MKTNVKKGVGREAKWWTVDTLFVMSIGVVMAGVFGTSFFARQGSTTGSDLVPASTLAKLIDEGARCQTVTEEDVSNRVPRRPC